MIRPITCFSHVFMRLMRKWEILMKTSEFLMISFETIWKISWESEKFWHSNENFWLSHDIMRKAADWSNNQPIYYLPHSNSYTYMSYKYDELLYHSNIDNTLRNFWGQGKNDQHDYQDHIWNHQVKCYYHVLVEQKYNQGLERLGVMRKIVLTWFNVFSFFPYFEKWKNILIDFMILYDPFYTILIFFISVDILIGSIQ